MDSRKIVRLSIFAAVCAYIPISLSLAIAGRRHHHHDSPAPFDQGVSAHVMQMIDEGRRTFRFDPSATRTSGGASSICMTPSRARASAGSGPE